MTGPLRSRTFDVLQRTIAPSSTRLTASERAAGLREAEKILHEKGSLAEVQVIVFLLLIRLLSWISFGEDFSSLDPDRRAALLGRIRDSKLTLFRKGFWGLATLSKLCVYSHPSFQSRMGLVTRTASGERA